MKPAPSSTLTAGDARRGDVVLAEYGDEAKVLAGGQSLIPLMNMRLARPGVLVTSTTSRARRASAATAG